jgi:hypothetical protein
MRHLDLLSLLRAARACKAMQQAASQEGLWRSLFQARWDGIQLPLDGARCPGPGSGREAAGGGGPGAGASGGQGQPAAQQAGGAPGPPVGAFGAGTLSDADVATPGADERDAAGGAGGEAAAAAADSAAAAGPGAGPGPGPGLPGKQEGALASSSSSSSSSSGPPAGAAGSSAGGRTGPQGASWRSKFRAQFLLERCLRCPKCGLGRVVPLVYGFPSPVLRDGMRRGRLILGGSHGLRPAPRPAPAPAALLHHPRCTPDARPKWLLTRGAPPLCCLPQAGTTWSRWGTPGPARSAGAASGAGPMGATSGCGWTSARPPAAAWRSRRRRRRGTRGAGCTCTSCSLWRIACWRRGLQE